MERYSRVKEEEVLPSNSSSLQITIDDSTWRLDVWEGGGAKLYPERPDEPDCVYYLSSGICGYGSRCRFNHPRNRVPVGRSLRADIGEFPERMGQPLCQYYIRTGTCKFRANCKYHHPRQRGGGADSVALVSLNYLGFPLRPGEKECSYYMRTGKCKFGTTCRFHHPVPHGVQAPPQHQHQQQHQQHYQQHLSDAPAIYTPLRSQPILSPQQYGVVMPRPHLLPSTYLQSPYNYNQMVLTPSLVPYSGWTPYQASVSAIPSSHGTQPSIGSSSVYGITPSSLSTPAYLLGPSTTRLSNQDKSFPQRPGHRECQYFMRTGDCKFGSTCRYHHPPEAASLKGAPPCTHFALHGICKFGASCIFDHSMSSSSLSCSPSISSLVDMPAAPYVLGSSFLGTLDLSSSSSNQRTELPSSSSTKPKTTTNGGSEKLAGGVCFSFVNSVVEPVETKNGVPANIEARI